MLGSSVSPHKLLFAVFLQLSLAFVVCICVGLWSLVRVCTCCCQLQAQLLAFVACIDAGLLCEPAHVAARCVRAAVDCLCGLN